MTDQQINRDATSTDLASDQLDALFDLSLRFGGMLGLSDLLDDAVARIGGVVAAETVSILLHNEEQQALTIVAAWGIQDKVVANFSLPANQGAAGHAFSHGVVVKVDDTRHDPHFVHREGTTRPAARMLALPLQFRAQRLGALCVERSLDQPVFSERDVKCLSIIAAQLATAIRNARVVASLEEHIELLGTTREIGNALVSTLDLDGVLTLVVEGVVRVTGADICSIMLLEPDQQTLRVRAALGMPERVKKAASVKVGEGIAGWVVRHGKPLLISNIETDPTFGRRNQSRYPSKSLLSAPLRFKDHICGVVNVNTTSPNKVWTEADANLLGHFANQAAIAIENARIHEQLEELATTDPVTGISNHRAFQETLGNEILRAERFGNQVSLLLLDVDHFKRVNDELGHQRGDELLRSLAQLCNKTVRGMDTVARYGGEEFTVILPQTGKTDAIRSAERLRERIAESSLDLPADSPPVTVSIGVATFPQDAPDKGALIEKADAALYQAKHSGKNRVEAASPA